MKSSIFPVQPASVDFPLATVSAGAYFACGVRTDGALACWGDNRYGQAAPPTGTFQSVSAGYFFACGVRTDGTLACWGNNDDGEATPPAP
jgi:alpha-tubulin suppressor-like RCC1 family protein